MSGSDVTVLVGGSPNERRVSVASGQHASAVLDAAEPWFMAPSGAVFRVSREELARFERPFERDFVPPGPAAFSTLLEGVESAPQRVYLLALHGGGGEGGAPQRLPEGARIGFPRPGAVAR